MPRTNRKRCGADEGARVGAATSSSPDTWKQRRSEQKKRRMGGEEQDADKQAFWSRMATALPQTKGGDEVAGQFNSLEDAAAHATQEDALSDLDETERAAYFAQRNSERKAELEAMQRRRVEALASSEEKSDPAPSEPSLTRAMFDLMKRTAEALKASPNAMQLETKIFANHGSDPRFAFLRADGGAPRQVWLRLKGGEDVRWEDVGGAEKGKTLLAGYESDSESSTDPIEPTAATPNAGQSASANTAAKLTERRARARQWAASQREKKEEVPFDIMEGAPGEGSPDAWGADADVLRIG